MAATLEVKHGTGAASGGLASTNTAITNARLCNADVSNDGSAHPMVIPASGTAYSWEQWLFLSALTSPAGTINNVKFYTDGSIGWGTASLFCGAATTYVQATGTSTSGVLSTVATVDASTYTSGSPLSLSGSISNPSTGKVSQYLVLQARIPSTASPGSLGVETGTIRYDET